MVILEWNKLLGAIAVNQAQKLAPVHWMKRMLRRERGGVMWHSRAPTNVVEHVKRVFTALREHAGNLAGKVAMEIGPGDNIGVAYCFLRAGCSKVVSVEKISSIIVDDRAAEVLRRLDDWIPGDVPRFDSLAERHGRHYVLDPARLEIRRASFETLPQDPRFDIIYSNDVLEHVADPATVFRTASRLLKPDGLFVNCIDLGGHNVFGLGKEQRPLDFLTCDDWLWDLMFSNIVTTNRVRYSEFLGAATSAGFRVKHVDVRRRAERAYLDDVRPHLLPRYRALADDDLSILECVLVAEKPLEGDDAPSA